MTDPRKPVFDAVRAELPAIWNDPGNILAMDNLLDAFGFPRAGTARKVGPKGIALIQRWEGCRLKAYPDPGTGGKPWTIGWGSTTDEQGRPIEPGDTWTQERADKRLEAHVAEFAAQVDKALGSAPTSQEQFDAMVSLAYNIGPGPFRASTLLRKHKAGDYSGAAREFGRWVNAGGRRLQGLVNRRADEAALYRAGSK